MKLRSITRRNAVKKSNKPGTARDVRSNTRDRNRAAHIEKSILKEQLKRTKKPTTNEITRKTTTKKDSARATHISSVQPKSACTRSSKVLVSSKKSLDGTIF